MSHVILPRLTDETFDRVVKETRVPLLVTFSAPVRCPACREQKPALLGLAGDGYPVAWVDVEQPDSRRIVEIVAGKGVPKHRVYSRGKITAEHLGILDQARLFELLTKGHRRAVGLAGVLGGFGRGELQ